MSGASSNQPVSDDGDAHLDWCHDAVQGVSRTFALTIQVLEEPMSSYICVGYLLCRIADTVEDAGDIPPGEQAALLRLFDSVLDPTTDIDVHDFEASVAEWVPAPDQRSDDWSVVANTGKVLRTFQALPAGVQSAIRPPARELVQGMAMFVERYAEEGGLRLQTREELEEYCYYAAGTVGILITNLVTREGVSEATEQRLYGTAESFGLLLQLVNVAKDVYDDFTEEDNVYLPARWLEAEGVDQESVVEPDNRGAVTRVVQRTADHARGFLDDAQAYLETVPETDGNTLEAWAVPYLLAVGTLRELKERPEDAADGTGVKVSREEVHAVMAAMSGEDARDDLGDYRNLVSEGALHEVEKEPETSGV
jgi:farnesyl-diphosphate farnesyltransferase